jgi:alpha-1,6-mannosyltransferase
MDVTEFFSERGGGVRSYLTAKGRALSALGHEHVVVAPGQPDPTPILAPSRLVRLAGPRMPYDPSYHLLWRPDAVRAAVVRERPDVLEIHSPYVAALGALACPRSSYGVRTFFWHSDFIDTYRQLLLDRAVLGLRLPGPAQDAIAEPLWAWVRRIGRACGATIAAARWQADKLRAHGVANVVQLPIGVDKRVFAPREPSATVRALYGAVAGQPLLVGVGRLAIEKRWDLVLEAFQRVRAARPARLVLFGDGPERARLERQAAGSPDVHFAGFVSDRAALALALSSADALVHGCPYETFGLSIAESVCCGLPVVLPDQGGAAEQAGTGFAETYPSGDAAACAAAIERLLARDPATLRASAREASDRIASVEEYFAQLVALYERLLAQRADT